MGEGSTRVLPGSLRLLHLQGGGGDPGGEGGGFVEFLFKQLLILHGKYLASIINHQHMTPPPFLLNKLIVFDFIFLSLFQTI